jgi:hypothetical protein
MSENDSNEVSSSDSAHPSDGAYFRLEYEVINDDVYLSMTDLFDYLNAVADLDEHSQSQAVMVEGGRLLMLVVLNALMEKEGSSLFDLLEEAKQQKESGDGSQ